MAELRRRPLRPSLRGPRGSTARRAGVVAWLSLLVSFGLALHAGAARAQLHWDASAQVGVSKRFLANRPSGSDDAGFGPTGKLTAHVALIPLLHAGGYFAVDRSPMPAGIATRNVFAGGLRAKGMLPWIRGRARAWIFAGFGYAGVYAPSYTTTFDVPQPDGSSARRRARVEGGGGTFFEVPFGIGASYKLYPPWELCVELGGRVGAGFDGSAYDPPGLGVELDGSTSQRAAPAGLDRFGLGLTVGILIDL